jgi:hypothetical protein
MPNPLNDFEEAMSMFDQLTDRQEREACLLRARAALMREGNKNQQEARDAMKAMKTLGDGLAALKEIAE